MNRPWLQFISALFAVSALTGCGGNANETSDNRRQLAASTVSAQPERQVTASTGREVGGYFAQWGVYGRDYEVADIETSGTASKLTFLNYAFGNVYAKNGGYECAMVSKAEPGGSDPPSSTVKRVSN
jgi:GH18 family chitinase